MTLDRDELAARVLVALVPTSVASSPETLAIAATAAADALLARLRPVAPVADAAPTDPRRTVGAVVTWVGFTFIVVKPGNGPDVMRDLFIPGDPLCPTSDSDTFLRWATREECERHGIAYVSRPLPGAPPVESPAAAPDHPSEARRGQGAAGDQHPAAHVPTPANAGAAAYVPQVGDVVRVSRPPTDDEWEGFMDKTWNYNNCPEGRVVETDHYHAKSGKVSVVRADGMRPDDIHGVEACRLVLTERTAAGLDAPAVAPESAREGLAKVLRRAWIDAPTNESPWPKVADAAIAFLKANGGAS